MPRPQSAKLLQSAAHKFEPCEWFYHSLQLVPIRRLLPLTCHPPLPLIRRCSPSLRSFPPPTLLSHPWHQESCPLRFLRRKFFVSGAADRSVAPMAQPRTGGGQWSSGLCDCFQDCGSFCCSFWCPCIVAGQLVEIIDNGVTSCLSAGSVFCLIHSLSGLGCLYTCGYRGRLRAKYGLSPEPCSDFCVDCWCLPCSLGQQYREMTGRGIQPDLGWAANRNAYEQAAPPQQKMGSY